MKWHRIWAIVIRHIQQLPSDFNKLSSIVYWPFLDIVIFGFVGSWVDSFTQLDTTRLILITNVVLWQIVVRADFGVSLNLLEEIWAHNISNLFSTPLTIGEWICATFIEGIIMLLGITAFCGIVVYMLYGYNILSLGLWFIPIIFLMFFSGITIGFFTSSLLVYWGSRIQTLAWMIVWIFAPVSGAYHPITVLPECLQTVAQWLPLFYATESIRALLENSTSNPALLLLRGYTLVALYLSIGITLFITMFNYSKQRGLHRLRD